MKCSYTIFNGMKISLRTLIIYMICVYRLFIYESKSLTPIHGGKVTWVLIELIHYPCENRHRSLESFINTLIKTKALITFYVKYECTTLLYTISGLSTNYNPLHAFHVVFTHKSINTLIFVAVHCILAHQNRYES